MKNSFLNKSYMIFSFSVTMGVYINAEYWPEYSFKLFLESSKSCLLLLVALPGFIDTLAQLLT